MKIVVTKDDIKKGQKYKSNTCPIALAIKRHSCMICGVSVSQSKIVICYSGKTFVIETPPHVAEFIRKFDTRHWWNRKPKPFEFNLPV